MPSLIGAAAVAPAGTQTLTDAAAMNSMGIRYAQGDGVPQDYVAALKSVRASGDADRSLRCGNIATLYFYGWGVLQSYEASANVLRGWRWTPVIRMRRTSSPRFTTVCTGVTQDHGQAFDLYRRAAEQGYTPAMANLGRMYIEAQGVERNDVHGYALLRAALTVGVPASMQPMANQELEAATTRLDETQLAQAREASEKLAATVAPAAIARR